jgi:hypothetical protein
MSGEKIVDAELFGVTTQNSDVYLPIGYSTGGTHTPKANPMRGTLFWDRAMYVLQKVAVAGAATGGSYTVTLMTDAVAGHTGLPIAQAADLGPNSPTTVVMDNLHQSPASPLPTHLFIDQTAAGGGITCNLSVRARQYRGTFGTPGSRSSERVLSGNMLHTATPHFADGGGYNADVTLTLGTSGSNLGMNRLKLWDNALFWHVAGETVSGTWDVDIIADTGYPDGVTTSIASTGTAGVISTAGERNALANNFYGQCPTPSQIIITEVTAGGLSDSYVVMLAKSGRGSMSKS